MEHHNEPAPDDLGDPEPDPRQPLEAPHGAEALAAGPCPPRIVSFTVAPAYGVAGEEPDDEPGPDQP